MTATTLDQHAPVGAPPHRHRSCSAAQGDPRGLDDGPVLGIGLGLVLIFRWWAGWEPLFKWDVITVVATLTAAPIGFLAGSVFDHRVRYAHRSPTEPEDHSTHGGRTWSDHFRPNTDHKAIGISTS